MGEKDGMSDYSAIVRDLRERYPINVESRASIFNFIRRVAWALKDEGFGLMEKSYGGENEYEYQGTKYSLSRIATEDRHYKILTDAGPGGANGATWVDEGPLPDRPGVSFKPALPPDDVPGTGGGGETGTASLADIGLIIERAVESRVQPLETRIQALDAEVMALKGQPIAHAFPNRIALKDSRGLYVSADRSNGGVLVADREQRGEWEVLTPEVVE